LELDAAGGGVGKDKASAETEGSAGGFERVSARDVFHEIGLPKVQSFACAGEVVLLWRDGAKRVLMAGALGDRTGAFGKSLSRFMPRFEQKETEATKKTTNER
jgi:hypothetical protein